MWLSFLFLAGIAVLATAVGAWWTIINTKVCPVCKETVPWDAKKCKHCHSELQ